MVKELYSCGCFTTHKKILSAIWELADLEPLSVKVPFRGYNVVCMDAYDIRAYKVGCDPLVVKWEELTPIEALRLKRACRHILERELLLASRLKRALERELLLASRLKRACSYTIKRQFTEANERLSALVKIQETFEKSPFGC